MALLSDQWYESGISLWQFVWADDKWVEEVPIKGGICSAFPPSSAQALLRANNNRNYPNQVDNECTTCPKYFF